MLPSAARALLWQKKRWAVLTHRMAIGQHGFRLNLVLPHVLPFPHCYHSRFSELEVSSLHRPCLRRGAAEWSAVGAVSSGGSCLGTNSTQDYYYPTTMCQPGNLALPVRQLSKQELAQVGHYSPS